MTARPRCPTRKRGSAGAWGRGRGLLLVGVIFAAPAARVAAQEDFRAADVDRPIKVEDAIPIKFREWEIELGARGTLGEGERGVLGLIELKAGLFRNAQLGVELEGGVDHGDTDEDARGGLEAATVHILFGLMRETSAMPAVALRLDVATPGAGAIGHESPRYGVKGILTRSFGRARLHANAGYTVASDPDGGDFWRSGIGIDYPLGLFSRALLADIYAEIPVSRGRSRVWAELGLRFQTSNWSVLDLGLATRVDEWDRGNANLELVVGVSRVFGIPGLVRVGPYPDPTIP